MVTDFLSWLIKYREQGAAGLPGCFGYPGLHHFFHLVNFSVYSVVGLSFKGWYIVLAAVHGLNAWLVYRLVSSWQTHYSGNPSRCLSACAAVLFLVFPFNMEAVIWKACLHYLMTTAFFLAGIMYLVDYLHTKKSSSFWAVYLFYILSLFTLELSFAYPFAMAAVIIFHCAEKKTVSQLPAFLTKLFIPQIALLALYFVLTKWAIGDFIGHYGAEKHLHFDLLMILNHAWNYIAKIYLFAHAWPFGGREWLYTQCLADPYIVTTLTLSALTASFLLLKSWGRVHPAVRSGFLFFVVGMLCLAPILNLFFMWVTPYENDRYSYLGGLFLILGLVFFISAFRQMQRYLLILYLGISILVFSKMMIHASEAGQLLHRLLDSFDFEDHDGSIYILAIPDNYNGMYMFRDYTGDAIAFRESLALFRDLHPKAKLFNIAQYNQREPGDSIKFDRISHDQFHIGFSQYGNWFWRNGIGFTDYKTESYTASLNSGFYTLSIDSLDTDGIFIYPEAGIWRSEAVYPENPKDLPAGDGE